MKIVNVNALTQKKFVGNLSSLKQCFMSCNRYMQRLLSNICGDQVYKSYITYTCERNFANVA